MKPLIEIKGLNEVIEAMQATAKGLPSEVRLAAAEATEPILEAVALYPPQQPPANANYVYMRGQGTKYVPTGKIYKLTSQQYGKTAHQFLRSEGRDIVAGVATPATYSIYLRGSMDAGSKYYGRSARTHNGVWETLVAIVNRLLPTINRRLINRINEALDRWIKSR